LRQASSTNPLESLMEKINRRTRVVGIRGDQKGLIRLTRLRSPGKMTNGRVPHGAAIPSTRNQA
jgi:transposase-like protein